MRSVGRELAVNVVGIQQFVSVYSSVSKLKSFSV